MEKSNTSNVLEPIGKIISKKIKPLNSITKKYNIAKIKNNKSNDDENSDSLAKNGDITDSENSSEENKKKLNQIPLKKRI